MEQNKTSFSYSCIYCSFLSFGKGAFAAGHRHSGWVCVRFMALLPSAGCRKTDVPAAVCVPEGSVRGGAGPANSTVMA